MRTVIASFSHNISSTQPCLPSPQNQMSSTDDAVPPTASTTRSEGIPGEKSSPDYSEDIEKSVWREWGHGGTLAVPRRCGSFHAHLSCHWSQSSGFPSAQLRTEVTAALRRTCECLRAVGLPSLLYRLPMPDSGARRCTPVQK